MWKLRLWNTRREEMWCGESDILVVRAGKGERRGGMPWRRMNQWREKMSLRERKAAGKRLQRIVGWEEGIGGEGRGENRVGEELGHGKRKRVKSEGRAERALAG